MRRLYLFSSNLELDAALAGDRKPHDLDVAGVGLVDAAIGTARALERHTPEEVIFIGTAGAFEGRNIAIGDLMLARRVIVLSGDLVSAGMRLPSLLWSGTDGDEQLTRRIARGLAKHGRIPSTGTVGCTLGVTENAGLATALSGWQDADVENLEAFGLLRACHGRARCAVVLGVTNIVGPGGGDGWRANFSTAMRDAYLAIRAVFEP